MGKSATARRQRLEENNKQNEACQPTAGAATMLGFELRYWRTWPHGLSHLRTVPDGSGGNTVIITPVPNTTNQIIPLTVSDNNVVHLAVIIAPAPNAA